MANNYFTSRGLSFLRAQVRNQQKKLKAIGREVGDEAGLSCDWHDNFGYEDAKRRLELESSTLSRLLEELNGAQVVEVQEQDRQVSIGVTVSLDIDGERKEVTVGAAGESHPEHGLITYGSPLGRALMRMRPGDEKSLTIGGRPVTIIVDEIHPPSFKYNSLITELFPCNSDDDSSE